MFDKLNTLFNRIIEFGFYALFAITPILFNPSRLFPSFEIFEWTKMLFVYVLTILIVSAWLGKMILARKILFTRTPFDIPLALFLATQVLAAVFSIDPHVSFFGYYSRFHGGLLSLICYLLLFYAFVSNRRQINLKKLLYLTLLSGSFVASYGILQKLGIDKHRWVQDVVSRVFSTLGQPNWLAALLAILLPISIAIFILKSKIRNLKSENCLHQPTKLLTKINFNLWLPFVLYLCLLFTQSRSGFIGFWVSNILFWGIIYWLNKKDWRPFFKPFLVVNSLFLIFNFLFLTPFPAYNQLASQEIFNRQPISSPPPQQSPTESLIEVGITDSADIRKIVWQGAIEIIKAYPVLGTGPETFAFSYYKFRPVTHNLTSEWEFLYNRAHNEFLNTAATSGLLGLSSYLLLIGWVIIWIVKQISRNSFSISKRQLAKNIENNSLVHHSAFEIDQLLMLSLLSAYISIIITNFFGFSVVVIGLYFYLIPAIIFSFVKLQPANPLTTSQTTQNLTLRQKFLLVLLVIFNLFGLAQVAILWTADMFYAQAYNFRRQADTQKAYQPIITAINLRPYEPVYKDERAQITSELALLALENNDATLSAQLYEDAVNQSAAALQISPQNVSFWKTRTKVFFSLSQLDDSFTQKALESILIAQHLAPTDPKIAYNVAVIYGRLGQNVQAIETLKKTIELKPDYRDAYIALAIFYQGEGDVEKARTTLEQVLQKINPEDEEVKNRIEALK